MSMIELLGYAAAMCTTGAYVPQVIRVWKTHSTQDISRKMLLVLMTGLALWLAYGLLQGQFPIVAANSVTLLLTGTILGFKVRFG